MSGADVGDATRAGHSLSELRAAAEAEGAQALGGRAAHEALARRAQDQLGELLERWRTGAWWAVTSEVLANEDLLVGLAHLRRLHLGEWEGLLHALSGVREARDCLQRVKRAVEGHVKRLEERLAEDAARRAAGDYEADLRQVLARQVDGWRPELPWGWAVLSTGVHRVKQGGALGQPITSTPIVVLREDIEAGSERSWMQLAWKARGGWRTAEVPRGVLRSTRTLVSELGDLAGCPVHSGNAADVVAWLADWCAANAGRMPTRTVSTSMGWQADGSFLLGSENLRADSRPAVVYAGDEQAQDAAGAWGLKGSWSEWCDGAVQACRGRPAVAIALYAGLASPLLHLLGERGFYVSLDGASGGGKSTALMLSASAWGEADIEGGHVVKKCSTTIVGVEEAASQRRHLCMYLDETKLDVDRRVVGKAMYMLPEGLGKVRGKPGGGIRSMNRWRLVTLFTGEESIHGFSTGSGASNRGLSIPGRPFGEKNRAHRAAATACERTALAHQGHLGRRFIGALLRTDRAALRGRFEEFYGELQQQVGQVDGRLIRYVAVLQLAAEVAHCEAVGLPRFECDPWTMCRRALGASAHQADRPARAYELLSEWYSANEHLFRTMETRDKQPRSEWQGDIGAGGEVGFLSTRLGPLLESWGYSMTEMCTAWEEQGLIRTEGRRWPRSMLSCGHGRFARVVFPHLADGVERAAVSPDGLFD